MEENNIVNSNAEGQENAPAADQPVAEASTATTNVPAEEQKPAVAQGIAQEPVAETVAAHDDFELTILFSSIKNPVFFNRGGEDNK